MDKDKLIVFQGEEIRRTWYKGEWYFVIVDIIKILTDSKDPRSYLKDMRRRDEDLSEGWVQIATPLLINTTGGKQKINCTNTENIFRIIQSIPSKKAEPFKRWLAKVGYDRVQEIENPELAQKRMKELYKSKGYSNDWIEKRVRGIVVRDELTNEWEKRGVEKGKEFAILTSEISKATFGLSPKEYKEIKSLNNENLRDHMNDMELIFTMLGEKVSTEITRKKDAQGFYEVKDAAKKGGKIAGNARNETEKELGKSITSSENYLNLDKKNKKLLKK